MIFKSLSRILGPVSRFGVLQAGSVLSASSPAALWPTSWLEGSSLRAPPVPVQEPPFVHLLARQGGAGGVSAPGARTPRRADPSGGHPRGAPERPGRGRPAAGSAARGRGQSCRWPPGRLRAAAAEARLCGCFLVPGLPGGRGTPLPQGQGGQEGCRPLWRKALALLSRGPAGAQSCGQNATQNGTERVACPLCLGGRDFRL